MKELVVISGKGGTGKTSLTASFALPADKKVMVDCDVDAADLHLLLHPEKLEHHEFEGGKTAVVDRTSCTACGQCYRACRFEAITEAIEINPFLCEGCGLCAAVCPEEAISLRQEIAGEWFVSKTKYGPFVHAKLGVAQENSGLLVAKVREEARKIAEKKEYDLIISDGPPGVGCAVISSITGTDLVLVVTEPTLSGIHDMERVLDLTANFKIKALVCINKYDINEEITHRIEQICGNRKAEVVGKIPYDSLITKAQVDGRAVVEYRNSVAAQKMMRIWDVVDKHLKETQKGSLNSKAIKM